MNKTKQKESQETRGLRLTSTIWPEQPIRFRRRDEIIRDIELIRIDGGMSINDRGRTCQAMNGHGILYRLGHI